jgi:subtilisin family serine protease
VSSLSCSGNWNATYSWTANAIDWAAQNGIRVTNNSNYYGASSRAIEASYAATRAAGMVHFASAGNSGDTAVSYPASLPTVNGVGALSPGGQRASFSCFGPEVFVTAPGSSVYAADVSGSGGYSSTDYTWVQGTSFASPYAAGVAALVISVAPQLGAAAIEGVLRDSARDLGPAGFDAEFGWGMVQLDRAIIAAVDCPGDLDDDLDVDGADLGILLGDWGSGSGRSDLDGNGSVSGSDLGLLLGEWGPCT